MNHYLKWIIVYSTKVSVNHGEKQEYIFCRECKKLTPMICLRIAATWSPTLHLYGYKNGLFFYSKFPNSGLNHTLKCSYSQQTYWRNLNRLPIKKSKKKVFVVRKQGTYFKELQNKVKFSVIFEWKILFRPFGHINISTPQYYNILRIIY